MRLSLRKHSPPFSFKIEKNNVWPKVAVSAQQQVSECKIFSTLLLVFHSFMTG